MANDVSIPESSALSHNVKLSTYRQTAFRVLMNTAVHLPWKTKASHLNDLNYKMLVSGYSDGFRVKVMEGGIRGYINHLYRCQVENKPINQSRNEEEKQETKLDF